MKIALFLKIPLRDVTRIIMQDVKEKEEIKQWAELISAILFITRSK